MTKTTIYNRLKNIQKLAWADGGDRMSQDTLFALQGALQDLLLDIATEYGMTKDLIQSFPYLYHVKGD